MSQPSPPADARFWAVIPAAGIGSRMGSELPKQYLPLGRKTVLEHTIELMAAVPAIDGITVAIADNDSWWSQQRLPSTVPVQTVAGGAERCHSVRNCLYPLAENLAADTWILVHDAARPCVRAEDIQRLMSLGAAHPVGALLGMPVRDTMKRCDASDTVTATVDRERLWHALTPQMFPLAALASAIDSALTQGVAVTDEASAMEAAGRWPLMVAGTGDNIKITRPEDLHLAAFYLQQQQRL